MPFKAWELWWNYDSSTALKLHNVTFQQLNGKGKRKKESNVFDSSGHVLTVAQPWDYKKQAWTKKCCSHCLARTIGSDMTNPRIPGRKWHTVESLRGLESHRTSGNVESTPEAEEVISQTGHIFWFLCYCPFGQLVTLTAVQCVIQDMNYDKLEDMKTMK